MPLNVLRRLGVPLVAASLFALHAAALSSTAGAAVQEEKRRALQGHYISHEGPASGKRLLSGGEEGPNDKGEGRDVGSQEVPAPKDGEDVTVPRSTGVKRLRHLSVNGDAAAGEGLDSLTTREAELVDDAPRQNSPEDTKRRSCGDVGDRVSSFRVERESGEGSSRLLSTTGGQGMSTSEVRAATPAVEGQSLAKPLHPAMGLPADGVGRLLSDADMKKNSRPEETRTSSAASGNTRHLAADGLAPAVETGREASSGEGVTRLSMEESVDQARTQDNGRSNFRRLAARNQSTTTEEHEGRVVEENAPSATPRVDGRDVSDQTGGATTGDPSRRLQESAEAVSSLDHQQVSTKADGGSLPRRSSAGRGTDVDRQSYPLGSSTGVITAAGENDPAKPSSTAVGHEGAGGTRLLSDADVMKKTPHEEKPSPPAASSDTRRLTTDEGATSLGETGRKGQTGEGVDALSVEEKVDQAKTQDNGRNNLRRLAAHNPSNNTGEDDGRVLEENASSATPGVDVRDVSDQTGGVTTGDPTRRLRESAEAVSSLDHQQFSTKADGGSLQRRSLAEHGNVPDEQSHHPGSSTGVIPVDRDDALAKLPSPAVEHEVAGGSRLVSDSDVRKQTNLAEEKTLPAAWSHTRRLTDEGATSLGGTARKGHGGEGVGPRSRPGENGADQKVPKEDQKEGWDTARRLSPKGPLAGGDGLGVSKKTG